MKVNTSITLSIETMMHLDKQPNRSKYVDQLILKDIESDQE